MSKVNYSVILGFCEYEVLVQTTPIIAGIVKGTGRKGGGRERGGIVVVLWMYMTCD